MDGIKFTKLKREVAAEFREMLELLAIFLNYYPDVQEKWLKKLRLSKNDISKIKSVIDHYAVEKIKLENKKKPQRRRDVIKIENAVLKNMFEGHLLETKDMRRKELEKLLEQEYPNGVILNPLQIRNLENIMFLKYHVVREPLNFIVFNTKPIKIVGLEVIPLKVKK